MTFNKSAYALIKYLVGVVIWLFINLDTYSQNLVPNPGFDIHRQPLQNLRKCYFSNNEEFSQIIAGWSSFANAYESTLFTTTYQALKSDEEHGYNFINCQPHSGTSMLQIWVTPKGGKGGQCGFGTSGYSGYIQSKLSSQLTPDKYYTVSFWVNVLNSDGTFYFPEFVKTFGITFSDKTFTLPDYACPLMNDSPFLIDSIIRQWYQINYIIHPTKPLQYIALGALYNPYAPYQFPDDNRGASFYFFLDDLAISEITKVDSAVVKKAIAYPYLGRPQSSYKLPAPKQPLKKIIYFAVNSDSLNAETRTALDSLTTVINKQRSTVYVLRGHADDTGKDNLTLSTKRVEAVRKYLIETGKLPSYRFEIKAFGSDSAIADNSTETGRRLNRRVEICETSTDVPVKLYQQASMLALHGKVDSAIYYLKVWLGFESVDKILLLHDPDLRALHGTKAWKMMEINMKDAYKKYPNPALSFKLDNLYLKDQLYRSAGQLYKDAKGYIPTGIDTVDLIHAPQKIHLLDSLNLLEILPLLEKEPWPNRLSVGERQRLVLPFILLHCGNYAVMKKYLPYLERACTQNVVEWEQYANLYDRVKLKETGKQRYGMQYQVDPEDPTVYRRAPLEDLENLNNLRASIGLPPIINPYSSIKIIKQ